MQEVQHQAPVYGLEVLDIARDLAMIVKSLFQNQKLNAAVLSVFFKDFADMQKCGLSVEESVQAMYETSSNAELKRALKKMGNFIYDGRSLEESLRNTGLFPQLVCISLGSAEKTGHVPQLLDVLAQYYGVQYENRQKMIKSMLYPASIFCVLTGLSIFISIKLVPLTKALLPAGSNPNWPALVLTGYAHLIRTFGWALPLLFMGCVLLAKGLKEHWREQGMAFVYGVPGLGPLMKNAELAHVFLNMYVYQKSGVNIIQTIKELDQAYHSYMTEKLVKVGDRIFKGASMAEAFRQDPFFPPFIHQNLGKGQISGFWPQYFERIYKYYDLKTKASIDAMIAALEPALLVMAALFLLAILSAFILPIYANLSSMGEGIFH